MPALNFKERFAEDVEIGVKRQSVRAHRKDGKPHAKVGDMLKLYTGMRTKKCRLLGEAEVVDIADVRIEPTQMYINGTLLFSALFSRDDPMTDDEFAQADGFGGFMDMVDFFQEVHGLPFEGVVIRWGEPR